MTRHRRDGLASGPESATAGSGGATMNGVLGRRETAGEERFDRIGRPVEQQRQLFGLRRGEIPQHVSGRVHPAGGPANADPHPVVVRGTQMRGHRPKAVVPVVPAAALEPDGAERKVQLVVDHHYLAGAEPVVPADPAHGYAGLIHERERLDDDDAVPSQVAFGGHRPELTGTEPRPGPLGKHVRGQKPSIVPVAGVAGPGIAEPSDQPPLSVHCGPAPRGTAKPQPGGQPDCSSLLAEVSGTASGTASGASPSSASICSAVGAASTCSTSASASATSVAPCGRLSSPAWTAEPISMPSTSTSIACGMRVASASTAMRTICWSSSPPGPTSPVTCTGTSTVTFSPRRTRMRSTCSMKPLIGSRCTALGRASWPPSFRPSTLISTFGVFSANSSS